MKTLSKVSLLLATLFVVSCGTERGTEFQVTSPDGSLVVEVSTADNLSYKVTRNGAALLDSSNIALHLADGRNIGQGTGEVTAKRETMHRTVDAPFYRQNTVTEHYNQLRLDLGEGAAVTFRVFDEGCAFLTQTVLLTLSSSLTLTQSRARLTAQSPSSFLWLLTAAMQVRC